MEIDASQETFSPDWSKRWTAEQAEKELSDFRFEGPGWYFTNGDSLLVQPTDITGVFWFHVWNRPKANRTFMWAVDAPVHKGA